MERIQTLAGVDSVIEELQMLEMQPGMVFPVKDQFQTLKLELRFLTMFSLCLKNFPEFGKHMDLGSVMTDMEAVLKEAGQGLRESKVEDLDPVASDLLGKVEHFKLEIREICAACLFDYSLKSKSCKNDEILEFMDLVIKNLKELEEWKAEIAVSVRNQIGVLKEKLNILRNLVDFVANRCIVLQQLEDFFDYVKDWVSKAACLSLLYWLDGKDEEMVPRLESMLSDLLRKIRPYNPLVTWMFVVVLKDSKSSPSGSDKVLMGQIVVSFVDFLLEELGGHVKDYVRILREGFIFLITLTMDPPAEFVREAGNRLFTRTNVILKEAVSLIGSLHKDEIKENISTKMKVSLSGLEYKFDKLKAEVRELYVQIPNSSVFNFPTTNGIRFIDFFLGNLKEILKRKDNSTFFANEEILTVKEELICLRPYLEGIVELQNEHKEPQDLWKRIINLVYQAEHVINLCSTIEYPIWYDMLCLDSVVEDIKFTMIEVKKINDQMYKARLPIGEINPSHFHPNDANASRIDEVVVGLKDESETIIDRLTRGTTRLDIVLIVGMPGLGKTTLAKKVYNEPSVKYYFNRCAWCCVSQVYKSRDLLLDILTDLHGVSAGLSNLKDEDLAEQLWKALKGRKYIIVIDDIWEVEAWNNIKELLPDDNNGSRVVFTSRIHNLVSQAKVKSNPVLLGPLSDEDSWELLQEKLFHKNGFPLDLLDVGKNIAKNCKGIPLAVVLVAGILAKSNKSLQLWKRIEESTGSQIVSEGLMEMLELSYKHLPDYLKSCFLYFGAFPEDRVIRVRKLINLWIAEGLVQRTDGKSSYEVAEEYLIDLIGRSLVIIAERSSKGGIKACRVHDLLRDLCLAKVQEEKFLQWVHEYDVPHYSLNPKNYENYRLCIDSEWTKFIDLKPRGLYVRSLLLFGNYGPHQRHSNPSTVFNSFKLLNVLDLECIYLDCLFPVEITLIVHLRYLAVWCHAESLPSSIANLCNLETFILRSASLISLPDTFWKMKSLRHVHIPSMSLAGIEHVEFFQLENLDTFSSPTLNSGRETEELLRRLRRLRKLNCKFIEKQFNYKPYKFPELSCLKGLESLKIYSYGLVFWGEQRDQFPAFSFPCTLRRLTLGRFCLPWRAISIIGQLPNLEVLKLQERAFSGKRWDVEDGGFLNLKFLELWQLNIEQWSVSDEPFPCIQQLIVKNCYSLEEIPLSLGDIPTLKKLEVRWCFNASVSARRILEEQRDMGNDGLEVLVFD